MKTYDPNISYATQIVEIIYQQWDYTLKELISVGGNCKGADILKFAIERHAENIYDELEKDSSHCLVFSKEEDTLISSVAEMASGGWDDEEIDVDSIEEWLRSMCVSLKIISQSAN